MTPFRCGVLGAALALVAFFSTAPVEGQVRVQAQPIQLQPGRVATGPLVPADLQEKLNLTAEQKDALAKIEKEYADKATAAEAKAKEARPTATPAQIRELNQEAQKTRTDYADKVKALLTAEQKTTFEQAQQPARRPGGIQVVPINRNAPPNLGTKDTQDKLNLTAEQREKLDKLQKDFEAKTLEVLTKEQKDQFEELKKQTRPGLRPVRPVPNPNP